MSSLKKIKDILSEKEGMAINTNIYKLSDPETDLTMIKGKINSIWGGKIPG